MSVFFLNVSTTAMGIGRSGIVIYHLRQREIPLSIAGTRFEEDFSFLPIGEVLS